MAERLPSTNERIDFTDPDTGAHVVQLTSFPLNSENLYFEETPFTPDSARLIFFRDRLPMRRSPRDLFRVDADGADLVRLTSSKHVGDAVLGPDGRYAFFTGGGEVSRVGMDDGRIDTLAAFENAVTVNQITVCGEWVVFQVRDDGNHARIMRCRGDGGDLGEIRCGDRFGHVTGSPTGNWISFVAVNEPSGPNHQTWYVMRPDGSECRRWAVDNWSHTAWAGLTDTMQGTLLPPGHAITRLGPEDEHAETVAEGPYFWHSSTDRSGEWMVADTNWPNLGLHLIHVPSGRFTPLCRDRSSAGHPERTHPHPVMSPDGRKVLFNSDRTGINHVYVVTVPEEMQERIRG